MIQPNRTRVKASFALKYIGFLFSIPESYRTESYEISIKIIKASKNAKTEINQQKSKTYVSGI